MQGFYIKTKVGSRGPFPQDKIAWYIQQKRLNANALVSGDGKSWIKLGNHPAFRAFFNTANGNAVSGRLSKSNAAVTNEGKLNSPSLTPVAYMAAQSALYRGKKMWVVASVITGGLLLAVLFFLANASESDPSNGIIADFNRLETDKGQFPEIVIYTSYKGHIDEMKFRVSGTPFDPILEQWMVSQEDLIVKSKSESRWMSAEQASCEFIMSDLWGEPGQMTVRVESEFFDPEVDGDDQFRGFMWSEVHTPKPIVTIVGSEPKVTQPKLGHAQYLINVNVDQKTVSSFELGEIQATSLELRNAKAWDHFLRERKEHLAEFVHDRRDLEDKKGEMLIQRNALEQRKALLQRATEQLAQSCESSLAAANSSLDAQIKQIVDSFQNTAPLVPSVAIAAMSSFDDLRNTLNVKSDEVALPADFSSIVEPVAPPSFEETLARWKTFRKGEGILRFHVKETADLFGGCKSVFRDIQELRAECQGLLEEYVKRLNEAFFWKVRNALFGDGVVTLILDEAARLWVDQLHEESIELLNAAWKMMIHWGYDGIKASEVPYPMRISECRAACIQRYKQVFGEEPPASEEMSQTLVERATSAIEAKNGVRARALLLEAPNRHEAKEAIDKVRLLLATLPLKEGEDVPFTTDGSRRVAFEFDDCFGGEYLYLLNDKNFHGYRALSYSPTDRALLVKDIVPIDDRGDSIVGLSRTANSWVPETLSDIWGRVDVDHQQFFVRVGPGLYQQPSESKQFLWQESGRQLRAVRIPSDRVWTGRAELLAHREARITSRTERAVIVCYRGLSATYPWSDTLAYIRLAADGVYASTISCTITKSLNYAYWSVDDFDGDGVDEVTYLTESNTVNIARWGGNGFDVVWSRPFERGGMLVVFNLGTDGKKAVGLINSAKADPHPFGDPLGPQAVQQIKMWVPTLPPPPEYPEAPIAVSKEWTDGQKYDLPSQLHIFNTGTVNAVNAGDSTIIVGSRHVTGSVVYNRDADLFVMGTFEEDNEHFLGRFDIDGDKNPDMVNLQSLKSTIDAESLQNLGDSPFHIRDGVFLNNKNGKEYEVKNGSAQCIYTPNSSEAKGKPPADRQWIYDRISGAEMFLPASLMSKNERGVLFVSEHHKNRGDLFYVRLGVGARGTLSNLPEFLKNDTHIAYGVGDVDGDGIDELLGVLPNREPVVMKYKGGKFDIVWRQDSLPEEFSPGPIVCRDLNGDGIRELIVLGGSKGSAGEAWVWSVDLNTK